MFEVQPQSEAFVLKEINKTIQSGLRRKLSVCVCAYVSLRVISPIDGKSMESISSTKMFQKSEYKENGKIIRWTEVHVLLENINVSLAETFPSLYMHVCVLCRYSFCRGGIIPKEDRVTPLNTTD